MKLTTRKLALFSLPCLLSAVCLTVWYARFKVPEEIISQSDQQLLKQTAIHTPWPEANLSPKLLSSDDRDTLSESLAQTILRELKNFPKDGKELELALLKCSAEFQYQMHPERKTCIDEYAGEPDYACMQKRGWGRKELRQILFAQKLDLNGDGQDDYIVSSRYPHLALNANNSNVYFVLLSKAKKQHYLAYAGWAVDHLEARLNPVNQEVVLTEEIEKLYGKYTVFYQIDPKTLHYHKRICLVEDKDGISLCPNP